MARLAANLGRALDAVVGIVSPSRAAFRAQERARAEAFDAYARYAAGNVNAYTGGFGLGSALDRDPNRLIGDKSSILRARVRQLVRDFPLFARIVDASVNLTVGQGYAFQFRAPRADAKGFDKEINDRVETAWWHWCQTADAAGRLSFNDMERLARRQEIECGEALAVLPLNMDQRGNPLRVQLYEPDWLTSYGGSPAGADVEIIQGLEINTRSGQVLAYWFENPLRPMDPQRVDVADVVHAFDTLRPGQLRGVSPLVSAVLTAHNLGEFVGAEIEAAKMAARYLAKVKVNDPARYLRNNSNGQGQTMPKTLVKELGYNIFEVMRPGEDLEFTHHDRPGAQFSATFNAIARMICVTANVSFELVTGDYSGINFSNLKGIRGDLIMLNAPTQARFSRQWHQRIFNRWLDTAHLNGDLSLPNYWTLRREYQSYATWQAPGVEGADVLRETKSLLDKLRAGLISPQDILLREGRDAEETLRATQQFLLMAQELGVEIDWSGTALKNNPAALGAGDSLDGIGADNASA